MLILFAYKWDLLSVGSSRGKINQKYNDPSLDDHEYLQNFWPSLKIKGQGVMKIIRNDHLENIISKPNVIAIWLVVVEIFYPKLLVLQLQKPSLPLCSASPPEASLQESFVSLIILPSRPVLQHHAACYVTRLLRGVWLRPPPTGLYGRRPLGLLSPWEQTSVRLES